MPGKSGWISLLAGAVLIAGTLPAQAYNVVAPDADSYWQELSVRWPDAREVEAAPAGQSETSYTIVDYWQLGGLGVADPDGSPKTAALADPSLAMPSEALGAHGDPAPGLFGGNARLESPLGGNRGLRPLWTDDDHAIHPVLDPEDSPQSLDDPGWTGTDPVPEPATGLLVGLGAGAGWVVRRMRRRRAPAC